MRGLLRAAGAWRLPLFLCLLAPAGGVQAAPAYLAELQARAAELALHQTRNWLALGHYEYRRGGWVSTADSPWFFRAEHGKRDPQAELAATLAAFFDPAPIAPRDEAAQCLYRARYQFLAAALAFDPARLPPQACPRYEEWRAALDVGQVALVFPAAYLNSPASMFGHTLLRLDARGQAADSRLLAYAVNFAANTDESNGLLFAVRGLSGQYAGEFGLHPYYEKVKTYGRIENRDLWEYPLHLAPAAIDRLMAHLWELRGVAFAYYFFDENCSYQLLALLEAARPELPLTEGFAWWAIPTDTIRRLQQQPGLVGEPAYRPALATTLAWQIGQLSPQARAALAAHAIAAQPLPPALAAADRARVLQLTHDWLYYRFRGGSQAREQALPRARQALAQRARMGGTVAFAPVPRPAHGPTEGHRSGRASIGLRGARRAGRQQLRVGLRPAYHDLLDPPAGFLSGAQIVFGELHLAWDLDRGRPRIDGLDLLDIRSLSPRDRFFRSWSWRVATGLQREPLAADDPLVAYLEAGPGLSWAPAGGLLAYAFAPLELRVDDTLARGHLWGLGPELGLLWTALPGWQLALEARLSQRSDGRALRQLRLTQQWQLRADWGLRAGWTHRRWGRAAEDDWQLGLVRYF